MTPSERTRRSWQTRRANLDAAFWERVDRSGGPSACWPWTGKRSWHGYGLLTRNSRQTLTHRVALERTLGRPLAEGEYALHRCDHRICCNPAHLYAGSIADNNRDARARGGHRSGAAGFRWRTKAERAAIAARAREGESLRSIARAFSCDDSTVRRIVRAAA